MNLPTRLAAAIVANIEQALNAKFVLARASPVPGGSINSAYCFESKANRCFVKVNRADRLAMFEAEAAGLRTLNETQALTVPSPLCTGAFETNAWLVTEWLDLKPLNAGAEARLGHGLAQLHRHTSNQFGFMYDNWIGATPQPNPSTAQWIEFFREHRLHYQLKLAAQKLGARGQLIELGMRLLARIDAFFVGHSPQPSLLHGDLWGGNAAATHAGGATTFDPAVYYGDRETDIAMTQLFGGFGSHFYAAYREAWPLDRGFSVRRDLYNLYHVLNHFNLFGGGYASQSLAMMQGLLAEI